MSVVNVRTGGLFTSEARFAAIARMVEQGHAVQVVAHAAAFDPGRLGVGSTLPQPEELPAADSGRLRCDSNLDLPLFPLVGCGIVAAIRHQPLSEEGGLSMPAVSKTRLLRHAVGIAIMLAAAISFPAVPAGAGVAAAASFTTPQKIGRGDLPSVVSQGGHLYVATTEQWDGIYYLTNRSGTWKQQRIVPVKTRNTQYFYPSIAIDDKGKVYVAYEEDGGKTPGIQYVTNRTGNWVRHVVTANPDDNSPQIAVSNGRIYIAFSRGNVSVENDLLFLATITPTGATKAQITPGKGLYDPARLVMSGGGPAIAYQLEHDTAKQKCGLWVYRNGTNTLWTKPPTFPACTDDQGEPTWIYAGHYQAVNAVDGLHILASQPINPFGPTSFDAPYWDLYRSNGAIVYDTIAIKRFMGSPSAFGDGQHIHTAWLIASGGDPANGTYYRELNHGSSGWEQGDLIRISKSAPDCGVKGSCDLTPGMAATNGRPHTFFSRFDVRQGSPTYGDSFLYWSHS